jgi:hypothetical protein
MGRLGHERIAHPAALAAAGHGVRRLFFRHSSCLTMSLDCSA